MDNGLELKEINGVKYYNSLLIDNNRIPHFFSTRIGGISEGYYSNLNLGVYTDDKLDNINENLKRVFQASNMNMDKVVYLKQVHGDRIHIVDDFNYMDICGSFGDAIITKSRGIAIGVFTADCVPVLIADESTGTIAAVHGGWKGTKLNITGKVLKYMIEELLCNPEHITVSLGPSIGPCCFEVKEDVADKFTFVNNMDGNLYVDLWKENYSQVLKHSIPEKNIALGNLCSMCMDTMFYSYRRDKGLTGRLGSFIQISKEG